MSKKIKSQDEIYKKTRGSWFGVNPVTKVIPNKKKNPKTKHKEKVYDYND